MAITFGEIDTLSAEDRALAIKAIDLTARANQRLTNLEKTTYDSGHIDLARENLLKWAEKATGKKVSRFEISISGTADVKGKLNDYVSTVERALDVKTSVSDVRRADDKRKVAMERNLNMKLTKKEYLKLAKYVQRMDDKGQGSEGYSRLISLSGRHKAPEGRKDRKAYFDMIINSAESANNTVDAILNFDNVIANYQGVQQ